MTGVFGKPKSRRAPRGPAIRSNSIGKGFFAMNRRTLAFFLAAGLAVVIGGAARAQDPVPEARMEKLEKQNKELKAQNRDILQTLHQSQSTHNSPAPVANSSQPAAVNQAEVKKVVDDTLKEQEAKKKAEADAAKAKADEEGYKVGTSLGMTARWNNGLFLETANKDFTMHIGGWIQYDNVFWSESPLLAAPKGGAPGKAQGVASGPA